MLRKLSSTFRVSLAAMFAVLSSGLLPMAGAYATTGPSQIDVVSNVTFCHATPPANAKNGWKKDTTSVDAVVKSGHGEHEADIIPSFYYKDDNETKQFAGLNWDAAGIAIFDNGCVVPTTSPTSVSPALPVINESCGVDNDSLTKPADDDQITYLLSGNTVTATLVNPTTHSFGEPLDGYVVAADGKSATYTHSFNTSPCLTPKPCEVPANGGIVTQNTAGWTTRNANFVSGGLEMDSSNWASSWIKYDSMYKFSEAQQLDWTYTGDVSGYHGKAIIFQTESGALVHYEPAPVYSDDFWTNEPGILPANGGGQGGPYSGSLQELLDTAGDINVVGTYFLFTSETENQVVLKDLSFNCKRYTFDYERPEVPVDPELPEEPTTPQVPVLGTTTDQPRVLNQYVPEMLPQTGASGPVAESANALWVLLAGLMTYAALYFAQPRRETDQI